MRKLLFLAPAALALAACTADITEDVPTSAATVARTQDVAADYDELLFPKSDGATQLSTTPAKAVWTILGKFDASRALQMGETQITDAQMAEIKAFTDKNLKADNQYDTYRNIFSWIYKNMTYASDGDAYLDPYDVFTHKRCICQGYANLLKTMCISQGIPALVANGWLSTIGGHAWNYVYADGSWIVSDPTNNSQYSADKTSDYQNKLIPQRLDLTLFEDEGFSYNFQDSELNVCEVKATDKEYAVVPWSAGGLRVTSFHPTKEMPASVSQLYLGSNIRSLGSYPESLSSLTKNLKEVFVDPSNFKLSSYKGVVYQGRNGTVPYFVPSGITRIELRAMDVMEKNTLAWLDNLEEIVVADGTQRIESYAVEGCPKLRRVYVPESVTYIDTQAFYNCGDVEVVRGTTGIKPVRM